MHEENTIEERLREEAEKLSREQFKGAPVIIVVGGTGEETELGKLSSCMTGSSLHGSDYRFRDFLGILQLSIQLTSLKHFLHQRLPYELERIPQEIGQGIARKWIQISKKQ